MSEKIIDIAVIGAGMAGLVCASELQKAGYTVAILEKSRGIGGRVATRRMQNTCFDHGLPYLAAQGPLTQSWIQHWQQQGLIEAWEIPTCVWRNDGTLAREPMPEPVPHRVGQPIHRYVAPAGMTAIAKDLADGLDVRRQHRVSCLNAQSEMWEVQMDDTGGGAPAPVTARAIALTIPAPQAADLLRPLLAAGLPSPFLQVIEAVEFDPCLTAIAGYLPPVEPGEEPDRAWGAIRFESGAPLRWIGLDSSKRPLPSESPHSAIVVGHSSPEFARQHLEAPDLEPVGRQLLDWAGAHVAPWLATPAWLQVHRWRYAFCSRSQAERSLPTPVPLPLVCGGDWCGGSTIEDAIQSGLATAQQIDTLIKS